MNFEKNREYIRKWREWLESESPTISEQLSKWLTFAIRTDNEDCRFFHQCEMSESGIKVLVRHTTHGISGFCMVIATVKLPREIQKKGWF